jgi:hypothetical protein
MNAIIPHRPTASSLPKATTAWTDLWTTALTEGKAIVRGVTRWPSEPVPDADASYPLNSSVRHKPPK